MILNGRAEMPLAFDSTRNHQEKISSSSDLRSKTKRNEAIQSILVK